MENQARAAGGGIFTSDANTIRLSCTPALRSGTLRFYSREEWTSLQVPKTPDDVACAGWRKNGADDYGDDIASFAHAVNVILTQDPMMNCSTNCSCSLHACEIHDHTSGERLPLFDMTVMDAFGQPRAIGHESEVLRAELTSDDDLVARPVSVEMVNGQGTFPEITVFVESGSYNISIRFNDSKLEPFPVVLHIRPCKVGETISESRTYCQPCGGNAYSFDVDNPEAECKNCPDHASCETNVILPDGGYWHQSPCSSRVERCITFRACDYQGRKKKLSDFVREVESCQFDAAFSSSYCSTQCREVLQ